MRTVTVGAESARSCHKSDDVAIAVVVVQKIFVARRRGDDDDDVRHRTLLCAAAAAECVPFVCAANRGARVSAQQRAICVHSIVEETVRRA